MARVQTVDRTVRAIELLPVSLMSLYKNDVVVSSPHMYRRDTSHTCDHSFSSEHRQRVRRFDGRYVIEMDLMNVYFAAFYLTSFGQWLYYARRLFIR